MPRYLCLFSRGFHIQCWWNGPLTSFICVSSWPHRTSGIAVHVEITLHLTVVTCSTHLAGSAGSWSTCRCSRGRAPGCTQARNSRYTARRWSGRAIPACRSASRCVSCRTRFWARCTGLTVGGRAQAKMQRKNRR